MFNAFIRKQFESRKLTTRNIIRHFSEGMEPDEQDALMNSPNKRIEDEDADQYLLRQHFKRKVSQAYKQILRHRRNSN
ncbi:hypothetical protein ACKGJO_06830 [Gracilimonas sp. Q87]|uniref:hypothetical protein n=1 Tax=Gracilimonas sp. Q87 TaxID=3384766 RepID=UPI0039843AD2